MLILGFVCFFILAKHEQQVAALQKMLIFPVKTKTFWIKTPNCLKQLILATFCPNPLFYVEMVKCKVPIEDCSCASDTVQNNEMKNHRDLVVLVKSLYKSSGV